MKNLYRYFCFAGLLITVAFSSGAFADVKIKSRQTTGGQTFENTTYIKGKRQRAEQNTGADGESDAVRSETLRANESEFKNLYHQFV